MRCLLRSLARRLHDSLSTPRGKQKGYRSGDAQHANDLARATQWRIAKMKIYGMRALRNIDCHDSLRRADGRRDERPVDVDVPARKIANLEEDARRSGSHHGDVKGLRVT